MTRNDALGPTNGEEPIISTLEKFQMASFACVKKMGLYWLGEFTVLEYNPKHGHFKKVH